MEIKNRWLWLFLLLTMLAMLNIGVLIADDMSMGYEIEWFQYIVNEFTGSWLILPLLPLLIWFFKKYPINRSTFWRRLPLHLLATILFGVSHTTLMYLFRTLIYQWFSMGSYDQWYGILEYRLLMEYFKQFVFYWVLWGSRQLHLQIIRQD